ncbi:MAG: RNA methyltransferase, partial [Rubrivivax sp.]|nr:RNA methyltransferase [Rubrivivax sp.]
MTVSKVQALSARDNPLLQRLRRLGQDPAAYRRLGMAWLEGDHLCQALRAR